MVSPSRLVGFMADRHGEWRATLTDGQADQLRERGYSVERLERNHYRHGVCIIRPREIPYGSWEAYANALMDLARVNEGRVCLPAADATPELAEHIPGDGYYIDPGPDEDDYVYLCETQGYYGGLARIRHMERVRNGRESTLGPREPKPRKRGG